MARGISPRALGPETDDRVEGESFRHGIPHAFNVQTAAGTSAYNWVNDNNKTFLVTRVYGYMTGAGAAADTVVVQRIKAGTTTSISDTVDVSALSDTDHFEVAQIDDANNEIAPQDTLQVTTASDALCRLFIEGYWKGE